MSSDNDFDRLARLLARVCDAPIALLLREDGGVAHVLACHGVRLEQAVLLVPLCAHAPPGGEAEVVGDCDRDERFAHEPAVTGEPHVRFHAGVALAAPDGTRMGAVCVMDTQPRDTPPRALDAQQLEGLQTIAAQVATRLEVNRQHHVLSGLGSERERMHTVLARQTRLFVEMAGRTAQVGTWVVELPSRRILWSDEVAAIYEQEPGTMRELHESANHFLPEWRDRFMQVFDRCIRDGTPFDEEMEILSARGRRLWVRTLGQAVRDAAGAVIGVHGATQDVTRARLAEQERQASQAQLKLLELSVSRLNDLVMITGPADDGITGTAEGGSGDQLLVFVNDAFARHTGYAREEVIGRSPRLLQGPMTQRPELDRIAAALKAQQPVRAELINYRKHGEAFWIELDMVPVAGDAGRATHWVAVGRDITQRKATVAEIQRLAFVDPLTGLPNRLVLVERLQQALAACTSHEDSGALMFIDLDNFKILNDTLGHDKGDLLLQQVARRLLEAVRASDTVARLGGDEFVVMLENLGPHAGRGAVAASVVAGKILAALGMPFMLDGSEHFSTSSIGVTTFSGARESVGDLLKQADLAMYQAKSWGRNMVCFFDPDMQASAIAGAVLSSELRQALRERQFVLHYQPQVGRDGGMTGVEALVRWRHPRRGLVAPADFIGSAEDTGLILPLGQWVLETACDQLAAWARRPETAHLCIAVNVSVRQFRHPDFVDMVMAAIEHTGIHPSRLKLELTETLLADRMEVTIARLGTLKAMGVTLALDDFGMGYSSLSSLKRIPLDQLKIDKGFVADILRDPNDAAIARAIIAMAQSLGLEVMAEGVETEEQRRFLAAQGCHCYQGYLFCAPLPIDALEDFMRACGAGAPA